MEGNGTGRANFAAELARRRAEAGLSLADVAAGRPVVPALVDARGDGSGALFAAAASCGPAHSAS